MKKKNLALILSALLIFGSVVGVTLAWLTAKTDPVVNTFTTSDIAITLEETQTVYKMIPGHTIAKDPVVTVSEGSEPAWLFVKLEKSTKFDNFMIFAVAAGWEELSEKPGVYYRKVLSDDTNNKFAVLEDNKVTVKDSVTKEDMNDLASDAYPTLTITAYATQLYKTNETEFTASEAWANVNQ